MHSLDIMHPSSSATHLKIHNTVTVIKTASLTSCCSAMPKDGNQHCPPVIISGQRVAATTWQNVFCHENYQVGSISSSSHRSCIHCFCTASAPQQGNPTTHSCICCTVRATGDSMLLIVPHHTRRRTLTTCAPGNQLIATTTSLLVKICTNLTVDTSCLSPPSLTAVTGCSMAFGFHMTHNPNAPHTQLLIIFQGQVPSKPP